MGAILTFITHRKTASAAILALLVIVFWFSVTLQDVFYETVFFTEAYAEEHPMLSIFVFMALAGVSAMLSPFSSVPLVPVAIMLWGSAWTIVFLISGWLGGHSITYAIGYYAGHPVIKKFVAPETIEQYTHKFSKKSEFLLVLLFRLASPAEVPGYVLGAVRYGFIKYFLATFIAEFPFAVMAVYVSEALIDRNLLIVAIAVAGGIAFLAIAFHLFKKQLGKKE
mgnify:CR=1 FL=1